ncbi:MAG: hypothetical protein GX591_19855 [Planctomycetes bacterium]|nr:hypothetical protein [Planctomycetota bacterium]
MRAFRMALVGVVAAVAMLAGCNGPEYRPIVPPTPTWAECIPEHSYLYGYWGPGIVRYDLLKFTTYTGDYVDCDYDRGDY